jgi:hypothetical protein
MPGLERERVLARIAEIQATLAEVKSDDVKETLLDALHDCMRRLADLNAQLGIDDEP